MYIFCQEVVDCIIAATMETMVTEARREPVDRGLSPVRCDGGGYHGGTSMTILRSFRFPEEKLAALKEIAEHNHGGNQTQALIEAIDRYHKELEPVWVQGYIRLDRVKDTSRGAGCAGCGQSKRSGTWVAVRSDGTVRGVFCDECADAGEGCPVVRSKPL